MNVNVSLLYQEDFRSKWGEVSTGFWIPALILVVFITFWFA